MLRDTGHIGSIAKREWRTLFCSLQGLAAGLGLLALFGLVFVQARDFNVLPQFATVGRAMNAMTALDVFVVPLIGIILGYSAVAAEVETGTIHFLASKPIRRSAIILGKYFGRLLAMTSVFASAAVLGTGGLFLEIFRIRAGAGVSTTIGAVVGSGATVWGYLFSLWLLAAAFLAMSVLVSTVLNTSSGALSACIAGYLLMAIGWNAIFRLDASASVMQVLVRNASPFSAWLAWSRTLVGVGEGWMSALPTGAFIRSAPFFITVIVLWCLGSVALSLIFFERRDVA